MKRFFVPATVRSLCLAVCTAISCGEDSGNPTGNPTGPGPSGGNSVTPPATWQEAWLDHTLELERVYYNDHVAVYYDIDVPQSATWTYQFMTNVWKYVKRVYGDFGAENRLYVVCHGGTYGGGRTGNIFDKATGYRSLSDVTATPGQWTEMADWCIDAHVHEVGHVVEGSSHAVHESPAFDIWRDSKWAEIFQYDVYMGIGMTADANRLYDQYMAGSDNFPNEGKETYWFRDWFFPIYDKYGGSKVLNEFFKLLSRNFPRSGDSYARRMNMGEFVHFWSAAAGDDLSDRAKDAFGWTDEWEAELDAAIISYPNVVY